jgi:hypothetical protein
MVSRPVVDRSLPGGGGTCYFRAVGRVVEVGKSWREFMAEVLVRNTEDVCG